MPLLKVDINPDLLKWARESVGESIENVASILKIESFKLQTWESGGKVIPLGKLEKLARIYKRPLAIFFLSQKPDDPPAPKNFRTLPQNQRLLLSKTTRLVLRRAHRLQQLATELAIELEKKISINLPSPERSENPEAFADRIRKILRISIEQQFGWSNDYEAFTEWINTIEKIGILVFQMSTPVEEVRGFSIHRNGKPTIVLNVKDSVRGRIFSLFHEFAHILLNEGGICDLGDEQLVVGKISVVEKYCNHFAGAYLVPRKTLLEHRLIDKVITHSDNFNNAIRRVANDFRVSREAILRRLLILGKVSNSFYERKIKEFAAEFEKIKTKQGKGRWLVPYRRCLQESGMPFISLVFEAKQQGKITGKDVSDYLAIRQKHLSKLEQLFSK